LSTLDRHAGPINAQIERPIQKARTMARSNFANFATRTIKRVERRLLETEDSIRQAAATVPTPVRVVVVIASILLAFAQLIRPR
jgi:hypothetical protein